MILDVPTVRRDAALCGHDVEGREDCEHCGVRVADMAAAGFIPRCDPDRKAKAIEKAMRTDG